MEKDPMVLINAALLGAVGICMEIVVADQLNRRGSGTDFKSDSTIVTPTDKRSDKAGKDYLRKIFSVARKKVSIHGEESGNEGEGDLVVYLDGLDGSKPFAVGAITSTVIAACYDKKLRQVVSCVVGEPANKRAWSSFGSNLKTWKGDLGKKNVVFVDSYPGFTRGGKTIFTNAQYHALHEDLFTNWNPLMLGSNGLHHALVAQGNELSAGAITTAIGGPWDVCPVWLVLKAGGTAYAWEVVDGHLEERDPLDVTSYDILVTGGSELVAKRLAATVRQVFSA